VANAHRGDPTRAHALGDLTTAYNDAAGRTLCPITVAGNLGGQTLGTGATLNGPVLARIAGVSLDSNTIVMPAP
jgi:hypothetical protein